MDTMTKTIHTYKKPTTFISFMFFVVINHRSFVYFTVHAIAIVRIVDGTVIKLEKAMFFFKIPRIRHFSEEAWLI